VEVNATAIKLISMVLTGCESWAKEKKKIYSALVVANGFLVV
jgi:hypothetical protein